MATGVLKVQRSAAGSRGFTLAELLFSSVILMILFLVIGTLFSKGNNLRDVISTESEIQKNSRRAIHFITSTLRQARRSSITIPNNNQINFDLAIYQEAPGVCSAFASVADGTSPVNCATGQIQCDTSCGAGTSTCTNGVCRRTYTYSIVSTAGLSQVVLSTPAEPNRVIGNQIGSISFQDNITDTSLRPEEIRVSLTTSGTVVSEKRTHNLALSTVVQVRN